MFDLTHSVLLGQGQTTIHTARYLQKHGMSFEICSLKPNRLPKELSGYYTQHPKLCTLVWVSPGIREDDPLLSVVPSHVRRITDIDYFLACTKQRVVGVTGTNGKSTVCAYVQSLLCDIGLSVGCYGNFQPAVLGCLDSDLDCVVLELSSFQLAHMCGTYLMDVGVLLNVTQDHISWHGSVKKYYQAKRALVSMVHCCVDDGQFGESYLPFVKQWIDSGLDQYTAYNRAAAQQAVRCLGYLPILPVQWPALPYRQSIRCVRGKIYINDAKSTNIASTVCALQRVKYEYPQHDILLVLAGVGKKDDCLPLVNILDRWVTLVVIGDDFMYLAPYIHMRFADIEKFMPYMRGYEGVVLFSPGGASFDQYKNYEERGAAFDFCVDNM